jgi:magnesium chelatase family protein
MLLRALIECTRLSRPLLDRIDLHVEVPALAPAARAAPAGEASAAVRARVTAARAHQRARFRGSRARVNAELTPHQVRRFCALPPEAERLLAAAMTHLGLSVRGLRSRPQGRPHHRRPRGR